MKAADVRELPDVDIAVEVAKRRKKLFDFRFQSGQEDKQRAGEIRALRRDIARMLTIQRERKLGGGGDGR